MMTTDPEMTIPLYLDLPGSERVQVGWAKHDPEDETRVIAQFEGAKPFSPKALIGTSISDKEVTIYSVKEPSSGVSDS